MIGLCSLLVLFAAQDESYKAAEAITRLSEDSDRSAVRAAVKELKSGYHEWFQALDAKAQKQLAAATGEMRTVDVWQLDWSDRLFLKSPGAVGKDITAMFAEFERLRLEKGTKLDRLAQVYANLCLELQIKSLSSRKYGDALLQLTVRTKHPKTDDQVHGCEVSYISKFWAVVGDSNKWRTFDKHSSPTTQELPAGNYILFCHHTKEGKRREGPLKECLLDVTKTVDLQAPTARKDSARDKKHSGHDAPAEAGN